MLRSDGSPESAHPILQAYLERDPHFIQRFRSWATDMQFEAEQKAVILSNFSEIITNFPLGNVAENIEETIACCQTALKVLNRDANSELWAEIQNLLGIAYGQRIKGDKAENLEVAIDAFEKALQVVTREDEDSPEGWGKIQNNLGLAYRDRIWGDKAENLERAIAAHQAALQVRTRDVCPKLWAMTQMNLAVDYLHRIEGDRAENQELALAANKAALEVYTLQEFPRDWAGVQMNLGNAYLFRIRGEKSENLDQAIAAFQAALQVYTRNAFPENWAMAQMHLGNVSQERGQIVEALTYYRAALEISTPTAYPELCFKAGQNMGNTAFRAELWAEAIEAYALAIEAVETSRTWVASESRRQEIMEKAIPVYRNMVQACINTGKLDKAFEYVERSRCKRLVDLMASNDLYSGGEIPPDVRELLQQFDSLQQQIDRQRFQNDAGSNRELMGMATGTLSRAALKARNDSIAALEAQKLQIWEQIRRLDPVLAGEIKVDAPNLLAIQQLISQPTTAILSFYTAESHTYIFVVRQNQIAAQICPGQGSKVLPAWIRENWLLPYLAGEGETKAEKADRQQQWRTGMSPFFAELSDRLQLNKLIAEHLAGIEELIIVPHHLLHLIPFAALPVPPSPTSDSELGASAKYLGDKFLIRYTPSCQILQFCANRGEVEGQLSALEYGTVEDAEDNLPCAGFEGEQIAQLCGIPESRRLKGKTQATRDNYRRLAEQVQVLHSCHHAQSRLDNPLESVLRLGDGSITLGQLMTPAWRLPALSDVFLSCCETGLGVPPLTEDILTLSTGLCRCPQCGQHTLGSG